MIRGIILASGFSRRMKEDKLLMYIDGLRMVEHVILHCRDSLLDEVILTYRKEEIRRIGDRYGVKTLYNPNAHLGQSAGIRIGLMEARGQNAYMFLMGDQPFVDSGLINRLIHEYRRTGSGIVIPSYNGKDGTPTIFSSAFREELLSIEGDKGGRDIIKDNPSRTRRIYIDDEKLGMDIDTRTDLVRIINS